MRYPGDVGITGAANFRDVGGLPAEDGVTRSGVLFRSGNLAALEDLDRDRLAELGLVRIVDLREDGEVEGEPSLVDGLEIETVRVPLLVGSVRSFMAADTGLAGLYDALIDESGDRIVAVAREVLRGPVTLVHCTVGKDRTGISVAIMLSAVGVDRAAVVADYARTEELLPVERTSRVLQYLQQVHPDAGMIEELVGRSPAPIMEALLLRVDEQYGSAAAYLRAHGLTDDELTALHETLISPEG